MYRAGMCSIFSELLRQGRLEVCDDIVLAEPKTKALLAQLKGGVPVQSTVIITEAPERNLYLSARNVVSLKILTTDSLSPVALVNSDRVIVTSGAAKRIDAGLA
jgi:large subunit ribosomal protein L4